MYHVSDDTWEQKVLGVGVTLTSQLQVCIHSPQLLTPGLSQAVVVQAISPVLHS